MLKKLSIFLFFVLLSVVCKAEGGEKSFALPAILSSNMVLQQGQPVPVWGKAAPGESIKVVLDKKKWRTRAAKDGSWKLMLPAMVADGKNHTLTISTRDTMVVYSNVAVGEVWLCSGQSNMAYQMRLPKQFALPKKGTDLAAEELQKPANGNIRVFVSDRRQRRGAWHEASGESLPNVSAVGYFFGKKIQEELNVPVGIITMAVGGTRIETWTPKDAYDGHPVFGNVMEQNGGRIRGVAPGDLYNRMIKPIVPFGIKGFLWYQGENNCGIDDRLYAEKFQIMAKRWRDEFGLKDAPFYYVLLAPHIYSDRMHRNADHATTAESLPLFQEIQIEAQKLIPNSEYIVVSDLGDDLRDIHPSYKWEVGARLARVALAKTYAQDSVVWSGPSFRESRSEGNAIIVDFDHCGDGLKTNDGKLVGWFEVSADGNAFRPAIAEIIGKDQVRVYHPDVTAPKYIRLGWHETAMPNLVNSEGLPACPFRSVIEDRQKHYMPPVLQNDTARIRTDMMAQAYIMPKRVMWTSGNVKNTDVLLTRRSGQPDMAREPYCGMEAVEDTVSILLDYGRELHGGLKLVLGSTNSGYPARLRIRFGESVEETCAEHDGGKNRTGYTTNDHAIRDFVMAVPRYGMAEIGNTGFRFVRIDLLPDDEELRQRLKGGSRKLQLKEAAAILRYRDIPYTGSFKCSDQRLNDIWMTGAYTVHLNMQEYLWDGIKRDRAVWLGDMHPEVATIMSVFGQNEVVEHSLDLACKQFPLPQWQNGISAYSMWYLIIHYDWYMRGGNKAFLNKHREYITGLIDKIAAMVDAEGNESFEGNSRGVMRYFLDWQSTSNQKGAEAGHRGLACWALSNAELLCNVLGEKEHAEKCRLTVERLRKQPKPHNNLKQAASLMALGGLMTAEQACEEVVSVGGAKNFSTFYGYYMLQTLAKAGRHQQALDIICQYWGAMLDLGATTFWEDFKMEWTENAARIDEFTPKGKIDIHRNYGDHCYISYRHSLCHGWASGPTAWLTQHVLGVEVLDAGCRKLRITPHLGDLQWAEGAFPTPYGIVSIRHEKGTDGKVRTKVDAPKRVKWER